jgi:hypothetical protein
MEVSSHLKLGQIQFICKYAGIVVICKTNACPEDEGRVMPPAARPEQQTPLKSLPNYINKVGRIC